MESKSMTKETAEQILRHVAAGRAKWGKQVSFPFSDNKIYEAIIAILPALDDLKERPIVSQEELTKLRRQLGACQNREKKASMSKNP